MARLIGPLVSVPAQNDATWTLRSANIADYIGKKARLVIYHASGPAYDGDIQLDDFNIGGNVFDPEVGDNGFETNLYIDNTQLTTYTAPVVQQAYNSVNWRGILPEGSNHETSSGFVVRDSAGTPSGNTGNTSGNTGSYYYFVENSYDGSNNDVWLRSPEVTVTDSTFSFYSAQNGANCGAIYAFLEIQEESPEAGLTLSGALSSGTIDGSFTNRGQNIVFAGEVRLPSSFSSAACLFEHGGAGTGTWLGVIQDPDNSNAWSLRFRSSDGADTVQYSTNNTVVVNVPLSDIPEFDGGIHTVAWEIKVTAPGRLRLWIDGREIIKGYTTAGGALEGTSWSGGDSGGWGTGVNSIAGIINFEGSNAYQTDANWPHTPSSNLRYYANQLAGAQAVYGQAVYGVARYGVVPFTASVATYDDALVGQVNTVASITAEANVEPQSAQAVATADTDIIITADATHTLVSVSAAFAQGSVGVVGVAVHQVDGVEATGQNNTAIISADSNYTTTSVQGTLLSNTAEVTAASVTVPTGTEATIIADVSGEGWRVYSQVIVELDVAAVGTVEAGDVIAKASATAPVLGSEATGEIDDVVVVAKAVTVAESVETTGYINDTLTIIEGQGVDAPTTGVEATGEVDSVVIVAEANTTPESVQASVTADTDIIITADANHTLISVQGLMLNGGVGQVIAEAQTVVSSLEATGEVGGDLTLVAKAVVTPEEATSVGYAGDTVVTADSNLVLDNVFGRAITGDPEVIADAITSVYGTEAVPYFSDNSVVVAKALQSVSGFALQIDQGTESVNAVVTVFYPDAFAPDRMAYVEPRQNTNNRTAIVPASESRNAIVPADSQSRVVKIAA